MNFGFGQRRNGGLPRRFKKRAENCADACSCAACDCDLFLIGKVLTMFALQTPSRPPRTSATPAARAGLALIRGYQRTLSPRLPIRCRQEPTCSRYGYLAVQRYGLVTGSRLIAGRISRCTRSTPHGTVDPVPEN